MARNRRAIVDAARDAFLRDGYGGTSMEVIAAAAGVSIMTLYRHARSKDDLFTAVISDSCSPDDADHGARMEEAVGRPLDEVLLGVGDMFQARLSDPQTLALFRAVMLETGRFPQLGPLAYRGLVGAHVDLLATFLARHPGTRHLPVDAHRAVAADFLGLVAGLEPLEMLLGLAGSSPEERRGRIARAVAGLVAAVRDRP